MSLKKFARMATASVCVVAFSFAATGMADATSFDLSSSSANHLSHSMQEPPAAPAVSEDQLMGTFKAVEDIPDSVLKAGDVATQTWLKVRLGERNLINPGGATANGVVGCVSAIGIALVTNLPVFKIAKIRSALKAAGGATTFVKTFKRVYDAQRKAKASFKVAVSQGVKQAAKAAGPEAQGFIIELFNMGVVYDACFE